MQKTANLLPISAPSGSVRHRGSSNTKALLVRAARSRFARFGYSATKVRDVAADAGVNIALINRYFHSKEGLFEACLSRAAEDVDGPEEAYDDMGIVGLVERLLETTLDFTDGEMPLQLLLLQQSSGDVVADEIRRRTLAKIAKRLAIASGWSEANPNKAEIQLRSQLALSVALGVVWSRVSMGMEPLSTASVEELKVPLRQVFKSLLNSAAR